MSDRGGLTSPAVTAGVARLLSLGFAAPDVEALDDVPALARGVAARPDVDPAIAEALVELAVIEPTADALRSEHAALFDGEVRCPPYEGSYESDPFRHARQMADASGFYRAFGAEVRAERADHVSTQLEFLAFLAARRAADDGEEAKTCREIEDAFLRDHLGRWLPAFCRDVARETGSRFYGLLAVAGERWILAELEARGLSPSAAGSRARLSVEADRVECGTVS